MEQFEHEAKLWRWSAANGVSWFFLTIDGAAGEALEATALMRRLENGRSQGFGAIKVSVRIGASLWSTSVFPAKGQGYMLPVKAAVRRAEGLGEGDVVTFTIDF